VKKIKTQTVMELVSIKFKGMQYTEYLGVQYCFNTLSQPK